MARTVAEGFWKMLASAGVRRCYGIVGDALNPVIDGLRRDGQVDFVHVRHEEYGVFAAVADARLTGSPVAVCDTAGPGVVHLINGAPGPACAIDDRPAPGAPAPPDPLHRARTAETPTGPRRGRAGARTRPDRMQRWTHTG
jgi:Thiamine pyrophosphate enzyme, N-terminal TPP binding domain